MKLTNTILQGLFTVWMVVVGGLKLFAMEPLLSNMAALHFTTEMTIFIGGIEVLLAIGLWIPRLKNVSNLAFIPVLSGAIAAHLGSGQPPEKAIGALIAVIFASVILYTGDPNGLKNFLFRRSEQA